MTGFTIQRLNHSANPAIKTWSWSSESNTRRRGTSSLHSHVLDQQTCGVGTQPPTAVGRLPCACSSRSAIPAELARRFERRSRTYEARALPTELHQHKLLRANLEAVGRIALPMISFAGRRLAVLATPPRTCSQTWSGRRGSNPRSRRWQRRVLATRRLPPLQNHGASSES